MARAHTPSPDTVRGRGFVYGIAFSILAWVLIGGFIAAVHLLS